MRKRLFGSSQRLRVDLHGVSRFGAAGQKALIRWEWVEGIEVEHGSVVVRSATDTIELPPGSFGMSAADLADELRRARAIEDRPDAIQRLSGDAAGSSAG